MPCYLEPNPENVKRRLIKLFLISTEATEKRREMAVAGFLHVAIASFCENVYRVFVAIQDAQNLALCQIAFAHISRGRTLQESESTVVKIISFC